MLRWPPIPGGIGGYMGGKWKFVQLSRRRDVPLIIVL